MSIVIVNLPVDIGKYLVDRLIETKKVVIINNKIHASNPKIKYYSVDSQDEDEYNSVVRENPDIEKIIYFPQEKQEDKLVYINDTVNELITTFKSMQYNNITDILLVSVNDCLKFMEEIIKNVELNVTIIKVPDIVTSIDIKDIKRNNLYNSLLGYMIGVKQNVVVTENKTNMIYMKDFVDITVDTISNFKSKLNIVIPKAIEFTTKKINEMLKIEQTDIKHVDIENNEWETLSVTAVEPEADCAILDIIKNNIEELKKKYILDSEHYDPLYFNKLGIFQSCVSSKIRKGEIFYELYNQDRYENKDEPALFLGVHTKKDIIKILKHRGKRYLVVDRILGQGVIETLKDSDIIYFSLSKEIHEHMEKYSVASIVIDLNLVNYKMFKKQNRPGEKIITDHESMLADEFDTFEFVNITDIEYNDLPKIINDSFIAIIKDNMYEHEFRISGIKTVKHDDPNLASIIKKECKQYFYGIMINVLQKATCMLDKTKNLIVIRMDETSLIPFCNKVFIKKSDLTKELHEIKETFDVEYIVFD